MGGPSEIAGREATQCTTCYTQRATLKCIVVLKGSTTRWQSYLCAHCAERRVIEEDARDSFVSLGPLKVTR